MDLNDPTDRIACAQLLGRVFDGRRVVLGPFATPSAAQLVTFVEGHGATESFVVASSGTADVLGERTQVGWLPESTFDTVSEEYRADIARIRNLPPELAQRIEVFDPDRSAWWLTHAAMPSDLPILGRDVLLGRPAAWMELEDKVLVEDLWSAARIEHAPSQVLPVDPADLDPLHRACAQLDLGDGVVLAGDSRGGYNGGGNLVRWVQDRDELTAAVQLLAASCDRLRVQPFLEGVPCSIHGYVAEDGTAALRPVELATMRRHHTFVYGGPSTFWDPPAADRRSMQSVVRLVGEQLRERVGYRGFFGVDGVLTADGFRPTELNPRHTGAIGTAFSGLEPAGLDRLLQLDATAHRSVTLTAAEVESVVPALDRHRAAQPTAIWEGRRCDVVSEQIDVSFDGSRLVDGDHDLLSVQTRPSALFAVVRDTSSLRPGDRMAAYNVAVATYLDAHFGTAFGDVQAAPDVRG